MNIRSELMNNNSFQYAANVFHHINPSPTDHFEDNYLKLRSKEGRIYQDKVVARLPEINGVEFDAVEWKTRRASLEKLRAYLSTRRVKTCLELGCGNGWLANAIANTERQVLGVDVNKLELEQAAKVFSENRNLTFIYGDIFSMDLHPIKFDTIVLSASLQYFPNVKKLVRWLNLLLSANGEIHIIDTPIYASHQKAVGAKSRSENYFSKMDNEGMSRYYFHHAYEDLHDFPYEVYYNPASLWSKLKRRVVRVDISVFPWLIIKRFTGR